MRISAQTIAQLSALTRTFDDPDVDLLHSLASLTERVRLAVPSYLGLSVALTTPGGQFRFQAMEDSAGHDDIRSSLMIPMSVALGIQADTKAVSWGLVLIVYASVPGALVDLAADLGWLTGLPLSDFAVDEHLAGPEPDHYLDDSASVINQALGVLLARERTPEQARHQLETQAAESGISRRAAAQAILAEMTGSVHPPVPE